MNYVEYAADKATDEKSRQALQSAMECVERIREITHSMLLYISPTQEHGAQACELAAVVKKALNLVKADLRQAGIEVYVDVSDDLPTVHSHPTLLQQVLINLILNARDAQSEQPLPQINIVAHRQDTKVVLNVSDNGTGMTREIRSRAFDPFFTTKSPGEGTGLGLTLSRHFMEQLGGSLDVESLPGRGCCMTVILPIAL